AAAPDSGESAVGGRDEPAPLFLPGPTDRVVAAADDRSHPHGRAGRVDRAPPPAPRVGRTVSPSAARPRATVASRHVGPGPRTGGVGHPPGPGGGRPPARGAQQ